MTFTTNIVLIIITSLSAFAFGMVKLGISRLIKGQEVSREEGKERVRSIREDIKNIDLKLERNTNRITVIETTCNINHRRRHDDEKDY